ncbi:hypothetical protein DDZ18_12720 [Marinicauda salina]|uniref:DUF3035 domain-containing protein n=1 Tax=Marinicauda salina TaxID=2135793 RepID=A0A2U2BRH8_9PROT|nr:hypothetical protein [Marinicauda salina]PWE16621.1 hypothetical protein DDZ18_12720 [Marinicauda salina]
MKALSPFRPMLLIAAAAMIATACANRGPGVVDETREAGVDALGLPRERPGPVMVDEGDATVPTPYGGAGAERSCATVAQDIARLTAVLGRDREAPPPKPAGAPEDEDDPTFISAEEIVEDAPGLAADAYRSTIVGLNPVRPVIRFVGRAGEIEREARQRREMALKRRAYLRGLFDGFDCDRSDLEAVFEAYGLTEPDDEGETAGDAAGDDD